MNKGWISGHFEDGVAQDGDRLVRVVGGDIVTRGVTHEPLDSELIDVGCVQQRCEGVAAPVGRRFWRIDFFHQFRETIKKMLVANGGTILVADDRVTIVGEPAVEIGTNLRVNGNDAVSAGVGLQTALQVAAVLWVIGKAGERQKFSNTETGIA